MSPEEWLTLTCGLCRSQLRIRTQYAHLRGRCPECGGRIEAPRPRPTPPRRLSDADEPQGLVPIDEDWPEPARLVADEDDGREYGVAATPTSWPEAPAAPPSALEGYPLDHQGWRPQPAAASEPAPDPYQVAPVDDKPPPDVAPIPYSLTQAELNPIRVGPPPKFPLWQGIFTFPFRLDCLKPWIYIAAGLTMVDFLFMAVHVCYRLILEENRIGAVLPLPLMAAIIVLLLVGSYAASCFMEIVEDTAAGNDTVRWSDDSVMERFFKFYFLLWLASCAALPTGLIWIARGQAMGGVSGLMLLWLSVALFPVLLLSSLSAHSAWMILDGPLLGRLVRQPAAWVLLFVYPPLLWLPGVWLIGGSVGNFEAGLAPVAGTVCAVSILLHARMIGRAGWLMTRPAKKSAKGKRDKQRLRSADDEESLETDDHGWG